jgi:hypothetical protein
MLNIPTEKKGDTTTKNKGMKNCKYQLENAKST